MFADEAIVAGLLAQPECMVTACGADVGVLLSGGAVCDDTGGGRTGNDEHGGGGSSTIAATPMPGVTTAMMACAGSDKMECHHENMSSAIGADDWFFASDSLLDG